MASLDLPKDVFETPIHPAAQLFPELPADELKALADDIKKNGQFQTILVFGGKILDGRNRLKACKLAGVEPRFERIALVDPLDFVVSCNLHRRHLTPAQRREVIAAVLKQRPEKSNRHVAKQVKVDDKTVASVREKLEASAEIPQMEKRQDARGVERPSRNGPTKEQPADAPKTSKEYPKYPVSNAVNRWLRVAIDGFAAIEKEHGHFMKLADKPEGWDPQRRDGIAAGLAYVQMMASALLNRLKPPEKKARRPDPVDEYLRSMDSLFAKFTAKEREACKVLGIPWPPTQEALDATFRRRAKTEHPDKGGNVAAFQKVVDAHECVEKYLRDLKQRR
jgi:hypothetical protein